MPLWAIVLITTFLGIVAFIAIINMAVLFWLPTKKEVKGIISTKKRKVKNEIGNNHTC